MRKLGITIGIFVFVGMVAVILFAATFDVNQYRGRIQAELEKRLDRKVTLGEMHLSLFPPRFQVQSLSIADDPKFDDAKPFLQAQELDVSVRLLPLLHKSMEISSLNLQRPSVELVKDARGVWNFSTIGPNPTAAPSNEGGRPVQKFSLGEVAIRDGQVAITDLQNRTPRTVYDHVNLTATDLAPNTPFSVDASVRFPGQGDQEIRLQGKGGPVESANPAASPFHGSLDLKGVGIAELQRFLQTPTLVNTDGLLSGHTNIASESGNLSANGQMSVDKLRIHGIDIGYPITANYDVNDDLASALMKINKGTLKLGETPLYVSGTVNTKPTPAGLDLNVKANAISISEAARLASAAGMVFAPGTTVTGRVDADMKVLGPADKPALIGTVSGRDIQASGKEIPQPVQLKSINLALTPTEIHSDNFQVTSGGTTVNTQFALLQYTSKTPLIDATLRAPHAELPAILAMAKAYGVTGLDMLSGAGTLVLDMHAAGPLQAIRSDQIIKELNGTLNLDFNNVRYSGVDVSHQLASIGKFLNSASAAQKDQGYTNILKMTGTVLVKNGIAQTNNLQALLDVANVGITGNADLVSQALNLDVTAVLSKGFSQQVGGTGIGGYMNTALANNQGELVIPAIVTGTFQNPRFEPNFQKIGQMRLKGLIPNSDNPLAGGASGILGNLLGQKNANPNQTQQGQQQQQQNPVNQLLGLFGKKKQNQNPPPK
jgi:AsmA protein